MAQPQIESFTISDDGLTITAKYDQILYGKGTFVNYPLISTPSDYSAVYYGWTLTSEEFFAGFDTLTFVSFTSLNGSESRGLPVYAPTNPNLVTSLTTNFQVTDVVNSQGEAPVNVTNLVLDTSNTPPATGINPPYDVLDTFNKKVRKQASRDKILCVYNTAAVYGIYDEPLIDAYFDEYGITNHIKVGIDFSIAANTDKRWWTSWGLDVYNQVIDNGIEQVCCGPLSPTAMSKGYNSSIQVDLSNCLGSLKVIKAALEQDNSSGLEEMQIPCGETFYAKEGSNLRNCRVGHYQFSPNLNAGEATGYNGMGTGYTKGSFRASLGSLDTETFGGLLGFPTSIQVPGLHFDQYEPSDLFWSTIAKPYQSRTLRMPCWRIGYFPYAQKPFLPTTTIIRQMVKNSKAAAMPTARNKEEKVLLLNTFYTTPVLKACTDTVYLSELWESLGYTKSFFGATNKPQVISDLTNAPGTVVGDTGLTKYEWQGLNPPANGAMDYIGEIQVTPQADDATNVYLDSVWMEQWDGNGAIGPGMAYRAKSTGTTFPILADIIVDQTRNFNGNYDGSIRNALQCKPGGIRFNATSHGQRGGIWDLAYGASASVASLHEPQAPAVLSYPQMISELLRGHTIAAAHIFTNTNICTSSSVWGDGLLQPYYEQAQEDQTMKRLYRNIYGTPAPGAASWIASSKGIMSGVGVLPVYAGLAPFTATEEFIWPIFPAQITNQGSGYAGTSGITGTGGSGSGFEIVGNNLSGGVYASYQHLGNRGQGTGYAMGDVVTFNGEGGTGMQVTLVPGPLIYKFNVNSNTSDPAYLQKTVTYNAVAGDTIEDICDGLIALINASLAINDPGHRYYATKVQATNGPRNGRYGIRISGRVSGRNYAININKDFYTPDTGAPTNTAVEGYTPKQNFVAGVTDPSGYFFEDPNISYEFFQRDINDNPIFGNGYINISQADATILGLTVPAAGAFAILFNGVTAGETAYLNTQVGAQPKVLKITFKNISRTDRADIVINGTDLDPWINIFNLAVGTFLNSNSGTAQRLLPLVEGETYEVTTEFTAANLGITPGGGGALQPTNIVSHHIVGK